MWIATKSSMLKGFNLLPFVSIDQKKGAKCAVVLF